MLNFKIKHRCGCCRKVLRPDGTCPNPVCPRYVPEEEPTESENQPNAQAVESEE